MKNRFFIHPHRTASPLAGTTTLTMAVVIILATLGFGWHLTTPEPVLDRYINGQLLEGLDWISQSLPQEATSRSINVRDCESINTKDQASRLAKIACYMNSSTQLILDEPDSQQASSINLAARFLLRRQPNQIRTILRSPVEKVENLIARRDPFRLPGCLFLHGTSATSISTTGYCANELDGWQGADLTDLPQSKTLWGKLAFHRQGLRGQSPNIFNYHPAGEADMNTPFAQGRHQFLSLDADVQTKAQLTAACYTGDSSACLKCSWCNYSSGATEMYEGARARMIGVLVVDVHNGGVLAAASNHTHCYAAQYSGTTLPADCPSLPTPPANRPWRLTNHALEQAVMPASLIKIPLAAGLMEANIPAASRDAMVNDWLVRSDTESFIDTVLCIDEEFQPNCAKQRLLSIQRTVAAMGWNRGCDVNKVSLSCGKQDLLGTGLLADLNYPLLTGRLLLDGNNAPLAIERLNLTVNAIQTCYRQGQKNRWRNCRGADFINTLAELYGQGNSMASPVGIAQLLLQLTAAESGQSQAPVVHLLEQVDGKEKRQPIAPLQPLAMRPETAQAIIGAMAKTHLLRGTAHAACLKATQPGGLLRCKDGKDLSLRLAGKTGTPLFPADTLTLAKWRGQCAQLPTGLHQSVQQRHQRARCGLSPLKWYAVLMGKPGSQGWDKAIIVLAERNWSQHTGFVDSVEDHGSNVAAEVGLAVANALASPANTVWSQPIEPKSQLPAVAANKAKSDGLSHAKHATMKKSTPLKSSRQPPLKGAHGAIFKRKLNKASLRYHHYSSGYPANH